MTKSNNGYFIDVLFVLDVIKNFVLLLVKLVVKVIKAVLNCILVILKRRYNIFELLILKLYPKSFNSNFLNKEKMNYVLLKTTLEIRNALDLKIVRKLKITTKEYMMIHPIGQLESLMIIHEMNQFDLVEFMIKVMFFLCL